MSTSSAPPTDASPLPVLSLGEDETEDCIEIPEAFLCPLTMELMTDPVVTRYGQSYERAAIVEWIAKGKDCPLTRQPLTLSGIITNHSLRAQIRQWQIKNEMDITLITHDPSSMGMFGYFMIPKTELEDTERTSDTEELEGEVTIREVARNHQSEGDDAHARRQRRPRFRLFRRRRDAPSSRTQVEVQE